MYNKEDTAKKRERKKLSITGVEAITTSEGTKLKNWYK